MKWIFILALFGASAGHAGDLYVQGGLAKLGNHGECEYLGQHANCLYDAEETTGYTGNLEIGYSIGKGRLTGELYARHESQINAHDFGMNTLGITLRYVLWRSR
jgi:hypothetical protein